MICNNINSNVQFQGLNISEPAKIWMAKQMVNMNETEQGSVYELLNYLKTKSGKQIDVNITDSFITTKFHREEAVRITLTRANTTSSNKKYCFGTEKLYHNTIDLKLALENTKRYLDKNLKQLETIMENEKDEKIPADVQLIRNKITKYCD